MPLFQILKVSLKLFRPSHLNVFMIVCSSNSPQSFHWLKSIMHTLITIIIAEHFRYQAVKEYFRGLICIVCPEHVITVAYCLDFRGLMFRFGAFRMKITKIKPNENFPLLIRYA